MAFSDFAIRRGSGYYRIDDSSGPYWLDDNGDGTLLSTSWPTVEGAATPGSGYEFGHDCGWFKITTKAGPYTAS